MIAMGNEITWIKVAVATFSDEKMKLIQAMPEGDAIVVIWFRLLMQAGKSNAGGYLQMSNGRPLTSSMLATLFDRTSTIMEFALRTFIEFGMIEDTSDGFYVVNWSKHQNIDGMEKIRRDNRIRQRTRRAALAAPEGTSPDVVRAVMSRDQSICQYCGNAATGIDHVTPKSRGGSDTVENAVAACIDCNRRKMIQKLEDFLNWSNREGRLSVQTVIANEILMSRVAFVDGRFISLSRDTSHDTHETVIRSHDADIDQEEDQEKEEEKTTRNAESSSFDDDVDKTSPEDDLKKLVAAYETDGFGPLTYSIGEKLEDFRGEYGTEWTLLAMREAVLANRRSLSYVRGILQNWRRSGGPESRNDEQQPQNSKPRPAEHNDRYSAFYASPNA